MRLLSRALFTFALLGTLAYGSYAFGKYVLSSRLFGPQGATLKKNFENSQGESGAATVTRSSDSQISGAPRASVEVLPADSNEGDALPPISSLERQRRPRSAAPEVAPTDPPTLADNSASTGADSTPNSDQSGLGSAEKPRRKRRKRRPKTSATSDSAPNSAATAREANAHSETNNDTTSDNAGAVSTDNSAGDAAPRENRPNVSVSDDTPRASDNSGDTSGPAPAPRIEIDRPSRNTTTDNLAPAERPRRRRRRERVRRDNLTTNSAPRSVPSRRQNESPVPIPENSSGGDSPVPIPE